MAYESWSGGRISSEETPSSRSPRGGYIPLADIPNAPKGVEMPLAKYQAIPSIRHEYVSTDLDMASRAQKLMQKPLPSDFEEAGNIRTAAAGKGQMAWGKAIESGGEQVSRALGTFGNALARLQGEAIKSKDETDKLKFDRDEEWYQAEIDNITRTKPYEEWGSEKKKLDEKLTKLTSQYGTTPITKERIALRRASLIGTPDQAGWADTRFQTATATRQLQADLKFHQEAIEENRKNGKSAESELSYRYLESRGYYSKDQVKLEKEKDAQIESQASFKNAMMLNPRMAMNEAKNVLEGGKSKDFTFLNTTNAATAYSEARAQTNIRDQETLTDLSTRVATGQLTDPAEVKRLAEARGLAPEDVLQLQQGIATYADKAKKLADENMTLNPAAFVEAKRRIADYNEAADSGGSTYKDNVYFINANIPPDQRRMLMEKLNSKTTKSLEDKKPEELARIREKDSLTKEISAIGDKGLQFTDPKKRELFLKAKQFLKENKDTSITDLPPDQLAAWREGNQWIDDQLNGLDASINKEPDFDPAELRKKVREGLAPEVQKNIGTSTAPTPPPRASLNTGALAPTKEQIAAAPGIVPSEWVATAPRDLSAGGRGGSAAFQQAFVSGGERSDAEATAYTKHEPGGNKVKGRSGPLFTMEKYARGTVPYVSASMDDKSEFQGKYVIYTAHPNVVFKVEDRGDAFVGKGNSRIDIAYDNREMETGYKSHGTIKEISEEEALKISGASKRGQGISGIGTGTPQSPVVATVEQEYKTSTGAPMTKGTLNVGGVPYQYRSGGYGRGNLPPGEYVVTEHMPHRNTSGMTVGDVGFSFALSDKYDPRVGGTRTLLRIHPDGGTAGTAGCIGIVGGKEVQKQFRDDLSIAIRRAGGKLHLRVG